MNMEGKADGQKHFSWVVCFIKPPLSLIVVTLIPSTAFFFFFFFLSSHGLTSSVLMAVTVLFISSSVLFHKLSKDKTRPCLAEESVQEEKDRHQVRYDVSATGESQTRPCHVQDEAETTDLPSSDTESSSGTAASEAFEIDWVSSNGLVCVASSCFHDDDEDDGSDDDDDDGLIEIALTNDDPKDGKKHSLWVEDGGEAEINDVSMEEENLIEIDISIGSIKKPSRSNG